MDIIKNILDFKNKSYSDLFPTHTICLTIQDATIHKFDITHSKLIEINNELKKMVTCFKFVNNSLHCSDDIVQPYYHDLVLQAAQNIETLISYKRDLEYYLDHLKLLNSKSDNNVLNLFDVIYKIETFREKTFQVLFPAHAPCVSQEYANSYKLETTMEKFIENKQDIELMEKNIDFIKSYEVSVDESVKKYYQQLIEKAKNNIISLNKSKTELEDHLNYLKSDKEKISETNKNISWDHL
jgi:hypothetical protein